MNMSIGTFGDLKPLEEVLDLGDDIYKNALEGPALPKRGRYTLQAPPSFPEEALNGRTKAGSLSVQVDPRIVGPTNEGYTIRFTKLSAKVFRRSGTPASQVGDYLRACGVKRKLSTEQDIQQAVAETANRVFTADLDWKAYNSKTQFGVEGMDKFPSDGNGGHLPYVIDPNDYEVNKETGEYLTDAQGNKVPKRLRANVYVRNFVAQ